MRRLIAIACIGLAGCSSTGTMNRIMTSWNGAPLEEVIQRWGYPSSEQTIAGHHLFHWGEQRIVSLPAVTTGTAPGAAYTVGGAPSSYSCTRTIEVDASNIVIGSSWAGNNCPVMDVASPYSDWSRKK